MQAAVLMPLRAFIDSDLDRVVGDLVLPDKVLMPLRAFIDSDIVVNDLCIRGEHEVS